MIVTQWFSCKKKPKHKGWYECYFVCLGNHMKYWNGKHWMVSKLAKSTSCFGNHHNDQWRGLAVKP